MISQYIMEIDKPLGAFCNCDNPTPYWNEWEHELLCDSCGGLIEDSESFV